ncbi:anti-sigma factor antagonist [Actinomadura sp. GC306]|uniref:STAS domain-containing protein n=1 Tax=Actinomadura sp. GC306 TaxID=2530367 RepID=UPI00104E9B00|nr:STAS domain-containing protein [Actinomadura sp. GC306]TDC69573.1 anti-sigma factor antagonist [Actinomadura sp. GC306]
MSEATMEFTTSGGATVRRTGQDATLLFPAEADVRNCAELHALSRQLLDEGVGALILDLTDCTFCDSSGLNVILRTCVLAKAAGIRLSIRLPEHGMVRRTCSIAGVTKLIPVELAGPPAEGDPVVRRLSR